MGENVLFKQLVQWILFIVATITADPYLGMSFPTLSELVGLI